MTAWTLVRRQFGTDLYVCSLFWTPEVSVISSTEVITPFYSTVYLVSYKFHQQYEPSLPDLLSFSIHDRMKNHE
jgi:hypothetical protein